MYGHVIAKFSQMGSLPHFLTHGALLCTLYAWELCYKVTTQSHAMPILLSPALTNKKGNKNNNHKQHAVRDRELAIFLQCS